MPVQNYTSCAISRKICLKKIKNKLIYYYYCWSKNFVKLHNFEAKLFVTTKISWNQNLKIASTGSSITPINCFAFDPYSNRRSFVIGGHHHKVGSHCKFKCHAGYRLVGSPSRHCLPIALWTGLPAYCKRKYFFMLVYTGSETKKNYAHVIRQAY